MEPSPYHEGERTVQARTGAQELAGRHAGLIRPHIPEALARFLQNQTWLLIGAQDGEHRVWASVLTGPPGFACAADNLTLRIAASPNAVDPLRDLGRAANGEPIGVLTIDLSRRLRARINGTVRRKADTLIVSVEQAYANCSKYIQRRAMIPWNQDPPQSGAIASAGERLADEHIELIASADTCFLATLAPGHGADVSHRGGHPGFIQSIADGRALRLPDFAGNGMYNTFGNLELDKHAGLTIPDFRTGAILQVSGTATVDYDPPPHARTPGAPRTVEVAISHVRYTTGAIPAPGGPVEYSRFLPPRITKRS